MQLRNGKRTMSFSETISQNLIMVFDVETTGLLPQIVKNYRTDLEKYPYIIQLSYIIYDLNSNKIVYRFNNYIKLPEEIQIPEIVTQLTGIASSKCLNEGVPIQDALISFYRDMHLCSTVVAHNYDFDKSILQSEFKRYMYDYNFRQLCPNAPVVFTPEYLFNNHIKTVCTMKLTTNLCKIPHPKFPDRPNFYKWPKLSELHYYLFKNIPENLHDAQVDVEACLRCFLYLCKPIKPQPINV